MFTVLGFSVCRAQNFIGIASSNYAGTQGTLMNPALSATSPYKVFINFGAVGGELQNNYLKWNAPYSLFSLVTGTVSNQYLNTGGEPIWRENYYAFNSRKSQAKMFGNLDLRGPAIQVRLDKYQMAISAGQRFRLFSSFFATSPTIFKMIGTGTRNPAIQNQYFNGEKGIMNVSGINEFYLNFSKIVRDDGTNRYAFGVNLKRFVSNLALNLRADNLAYEVVPTDATNQRQRIENVTAVGSFFHAAPSTGDLTGSWILGQMTKLSGIGKGFGLDLGVEYIYSERRSSFGQDSPVDYKLKMAAALTDIGFVSYSDPNDVVVGHVNSTGTVIQPATFYQISSTNEFIQDLENQFNPDPTQYQHAFRVYMPVRLQLNFDYHYSKHIFIAGNLRQAILPRKKFLGPIAYSGLSLVPRYEKRNIEVAVPISLDQDYSQLNFGSTVRLGPLFFGIDNIRGWFNMFKPSSASVHVGLAYGILGEKRDKGGLNCYYEEPVPKYRRKKGLFHFKK
ncbi:DUF5723 family protein [Marinilongibacter aquaticus]|uniref:DUF5723 family protein n=1 Tax=Marinilongibacter aquaticus TaxID=2975157 RepID=UPI0021BD8A19|nr:DUF5723 family protein [Marinilongibacter aquaticus]UBM59602.1 DUF5723 family protein [Marinilongibacter aquaticus]